MAFGLLLALLMVWVTPFPASSAVAPATSDYLVKTWETDDGLPENSATAITMDQEGYLWIGTFNGLTRFNGAGFTVFNPENTPAMPSAFIVNVYADRRGRLWVSTPEGLVVKEGAQWRRMGTDEGWVGNYVRTFSGRSDGDLLITTFDGRVVTFQSGRLTELPPPPGERDKGYVGAVDETGQWWVAQHQFVGRWNGHQWLRVLTPDPSVPPASVAMAPAYHGGMWVLLSRTLIKFRNGTEESRVSLPNLAGGIWSMAEDSRTNLWICSYDSGLYTRAPSGDLLHWTTASGLGTMFTRCVFEDKEQNLWLGSSGGGLRRLTRRRFVDAGAGNVLAAQMVRSVAPAREGGMWISSHQGGLYHHDGRSVSHVPIPGPRNVAVPGLTVIEDRVGRVWFGDAYGCWWRDGQGEFQRIPPSEIKGNHVRALFEDSKGRIWIGSSGGAGVYDGRSFRYLGREAGLAAGEITGFGEDSTGRVWLAGASEVYREDAERFNPVRGADGQPLGAVLCFYLDGDGVMWMGTRPSGLIYWRNGIVKRIGVEHGLPELEIRGIIGDDLGYFWMPSNRGILRASRKQLHAVASGGVDLHEVQVFDTHDGLPSADGYTGQPICARDVQGRLWFTTRRGVTLIDPAGFWLNSERPPVHVEFLAYRRAYGGEKRARSDSRSSVRQEDEVRLTAPFPERLQLPPGTHDIELGFVALSYSAPDKVRFEYELQGRGPRYRALGPQPVARFNELPSGDYVFRIWASNNDGLWSRDGAQLAFSIPPYYWQTWWFRSAAMMLLIALGALLAREWSRSQRIRAAERAGATRELHRLREELAHSSRVATVGQLSSALAHELSQPLGAILRNAEAAEMLMDRHPLDLPELRAILADIRADDERAGKVIDRTRDFLKRRHAEHISLSVQELLSEAAELVRSNALERQVQVNVKVAPGLPIVRGDRVQLQQVLLNLMLNAIDAMSLQPVESRRLWLLGQWSEKGGVEVCVEDSGPGIPVASIRQLFDPFYTTKPHGLGLGLSISRSIIEMHGGQLVAANRAAGGASFSFTLPVAGATVN